MHHNNKQGMHCIAQKLLGWFEHDSANELLEYTYNGHENHVHFH